MTASYPIIRNCNFESRDDAQGQAVHEARKAVESGRCDWPSLLDALEDLEEVLTEHAGDASERSVRACNHAEAAVVASYGDWTSSQEEG